MAGQKKEEDNEYVKKTLSVSEANNHLALNLHKVLTKDQKNVFFSPLSISTAMAMAFQGAKADTADEMRKVLGYDIAKISNDQVLNSYQHLMEVMTAGSESYNLAIANALMVQKDFVLCDPFKSALQKSFQALAKDVDFQNDMQSALAEVNDFVKEKTNGKIPQLLEKLDPKTVLVLLNAVYFKGSWLHPFKKQATYPQLFFNNGLETNSKDVQMMHLKESFPFVQDESFKALEIPYKADLAMLILLPNSKTGLHNLETNLSGNFIEDLRKSMRITKVNVSFPKFKMEFHQSFKKTFQEIGLKSIFEFGANFRGICDSVEVVVSDVIHKAVLEVNEEGSEAAAATAVIFAKRCAIISPPIPEFIADHPFMFAIYDFRNNLVLFFGRVEEL